MLSPKFFKSQTKDRYFEAGSRPAVFPVSILAGGAVKQGGGLFFAPWGLKILGIKL